MKGKEIRILSLLALDTVFFFLEIIIGYTVNSLALIADSFHMLNDIFSLIVALWAVKVAKSRGVDSKYTYGWQRAEILGALINAVFLIALCMTIFLEAIQRFIQVPDISNPKLILIVGCAGLASNLIGLVLFHEHGHSHSHGGGAAVLDDEENGHSHSHGHEHAHSHQHAVDITYQQRLVDDNAPIAEALPSSYLSKISETTGLLDASAQNPNYNSTGSDSDSEAHPAPEAISSAPTEPRHHTRSLSVSSTTHQDHFHVKAKGSSAPQKSLNMEGVFLHVMGDALGNIGVIITALFIWKTDYSWKFYMDPVTSLVITAIIFSSALPLCRRTSAILLQGVPQSVDADAVRDDIVSLPGVIDIHDLHIWILSENLNVATLHVSVSSGPDEFMKLAKRIRTCMRGHGIASTTIQPEFQQTSSSSPSSSAAVLNPNTTTSSTHSHSHHQSGLHRSPSPDSTPECVLQGNKSSGGLSKANV